MQRAVRIRAVVAQQHFVFVTVPGDVAAEFVAEELTGLVVFDVRDRAQNVGQSKVIFLLAANPTVGGENVLPSVVVIVEHG